jgi:hypothetical protein
MQTMENNGVLTMDETHEYLWSVQNSPDRVSYDTYDID